MARLHILKNRQAEWLEAVRLRSGSASDKQVVNDVGTEINVMIMELRHCPVGLATRQKQLTIDALQNLCREPQLDIEPRLHLLVTQAFDALLDRVAGSKPLELGTAWVGPPAPELTIRLQSMPGVAALPNDAHVAAIQRWSRESRAMRDATTRQIAVVQAKLLPSPIDPMGQLHQRQLKLNQQIEQETIGSNQTDAKLIFKNTIDPFTLALEVGARSEALTRGEVLLKQFTAWARKSPRWKSLADEQQGILAELKTLTDAPALELARQNRDLESLQTEADELAHRSAALIRAWPTAEPMTALAALSQRYAQIVEDVKAFPHPPTTDTATKLNTLAQSLAPKSVPEVLPERAREHPLLDAIEWSRRGPQSTPTEQSTIRARVIEALERFLRWS